MSRQCGGSEGGREGGREGEGNGEGETKTLWLCNSNTPPTLLHQGGVAII